eukprot:3332778-Rhodomonas_salina.2
MARRPTARPPDSATSARLPPSCAWIICARKNSPNCLWKRVKRVTVSNGRGGNAPGRVWRATGRMRAGPGLSVLGELALSVV